MTKRLLKVVGLSRDATSKTLIVRFGERDYQVRIEQVEVTGLSNLRLVSREDLDSIFGKALEPYHAALVSELANEKYVSKGVTLDLDELDKLEANGRSFKDGIPSV